MKVAILSDIHANLAALTAVLADVDATAPDATLWHAGDVVGYNAEPNEVVALLQQHGAIGVLGNHDAAAIGAISTDDFNPAAAEAVEWTARVITPETRAWLSNLPRILELGDVTLTHGSPRDPLWEYVSDEASASQNLATLRTRLLIHGHTHVPRLWEASAGIGGDVLDQPIGSDAIALGAHALLNAGSVGQPRDRDTRACWVLWEHDDEQGSRLGHATWRRVAYDVALTQSRVRAAGLPEFLAARLGEGR